MKPILIIGSIVVVGIITYSLIKQIILARWKRRLKSAEFKQLYKESILEVVEACEKLNLTYWFTEGTLIGLLRYGANDHESIEMSIDEDIDVMIEVKDQNHWIQVKNRLIEELKQVGWGGLYERTTSSSKRGRIDKMQLWKIRSSNMKTHVDFHSYFISGDFAYTHTEPNSYPFGYWEDKVPTSMIHPMKVCLCYDKEVPCPNDPIGLLKGWNGGEYMDSNIAFPLGRITNHQRSVIVDKAKELNQLGYASMIEEI